MTTITPDVSAEIHAVPLSEEDFAVSIDELPIIIAEGSVEELTIGDAVFVRHTGATARIDAQASVIPTVGSPEVRFRSSDVNRAIVDSQGRVTTTGTGDVTIFAETPYLRKKVTHAARTEDPTTVDTFQEYIAGSLGLHVNTAMDALVLVGGELPLFTVKNHTSSSYQRNAANWLAAHDFTGVSPWNSNAQNRKGGAAITPRHLVHAWHSGYTPPVGTEIRFVASDGTVITRTIAARAQVGNTDIGVTQLNEDLPESIAVYKILPANWRDYMVTVFPARTAIISLDQEQKSLCRDMTGASGTSIGHQNATGARAALTETLIAGDSGQPNFMLIEGELVLLGCHHGPGVFPHLASHIGEINAVLSELGGGGSLSIADISAFTDFS